MNDFRFTVPGKPVPWARPRPRQGRFKKMITPTKQRDYMALVAACALRAGAPSPRPGAVRLVLDFYFCPPVSWPKWKKARALSGEFRHVSTPDASNLVKIVEDALNGIAWDDDARIVELRATKHFGDVARTEVVASSLSHFSNR